MRSATSVPFDTWRKRNGKTKARPPYGFCFFEGRVIKSPTEYPTLLLIQSLRKQGRSITEITEKLAEKKIRSRTGKPWSYNVIKAIHRRFDDGTIAKLTKGNSETKRSKK
jgi:Recombinase